MRQAGAGTTGRLALAGRRRGWAAALSLGALAAAVAAGCGESASTPQAAFDHLRAVLARRVPAGWRVAYGHDVPFAVRSPAGPDDIVVYKTEPVRLQGRPPAPPPDPNPGPIYFALSLKPFIPSDQYADVWKKNEAVRKEHERVLHRVANVPRNEQGQLMPRGTVESQQVASFREEYAKLPPFDPDLPTRYFRGVGVNIRDFRTVLVPVERQWQQEMNQVYVQLMLVLSEYER